MVQKMWSHITTAIIVIAVIVMTLAMASIVFYKYLYPRIRGEQIPPEVQEKIESSFDIFVGNINNCKDIQNTDCLCKVFDRWPGAFPTNSKVIIQQSGKKAIINCSHRGAVIENVKISAMYSNKEFVNYVPRKEIYFKHEPPTYIQGGGIGTGISGGLHFDQLVISPYMYKKGEELYFIIGRKQIEIEKQIRVCETSS